MRQLIFFCLPAYSFLCEPCNSSIQTRCETGGWLVKINFTNNMCHYSSGERSTDLKKKSPSLYHRGKSDLEGGCKQRAKQKFFRTTNCWRFQILDILPVPGENPRGFVSCTILNMFRKLNVLCTTVHHLCKSANTQLIMCN